MKENTRKKLAAVAIVGTVSLVLLGGTAAQLTDQGSTTPQELQAGTVNIDLVEGSYWDTELLRLAVDDTVTREFTLNNLSNLSIDRLTLTGSVVASTGPLGGNLSEAIQVEILDEQGVNLYGLYEALQGPTTLANMAEREISFPQAVLPGADVPLTVRYTLVGAPAGEEEADARTKGQRDTGANPDNKYQGATANVRFTMNAMQRAGQEHSASAEDVVAKTGALLDRLRVAVAADSTPVASYTEDHWRSLDSELADPAITVTTTGEPLPLETGQSVVGVVVNFPGTNMVGFMWYYGEGSQAKPLAASVGEQGVTGREVGYSASDFLCVYSEMGIAPISGSGMTAATWNATGLEEFYRTGFTAPEDKVVTTGTNPWVTVITTNLYGTIGDVTCQHSVEGDRVYLD